MGYAGNRPVGYGLLPDYTIWAGAHATSAGGVPYFDANRQMQHEATVFYYDAATNTLYAGNFAGAVLPTGLTAGRVVFVAAGGALTDDAKLLFDPAALAGQGRLSSSGQFEASASGEPGFYAPASQIRTGYAVASAFFASAGGITVGMAGNALVATAGDVTAVGGFRQNIGGWVQENVAASQAAVPLARFATNNPISRWTAPRAGSITAVSVWFSAALTAGGADAFKVDVWKNGVATGWTLSVGSGSQSGQATAAKDTITFAAGDTLDVRITTTATFAPTTTDVVVDVEVEN